MARIPQLPAAVRIPDHLQVPGMEFVEQGGGDGTHPTLAQHQALGLAASGHAHAVADTTGLQAALDGKEVAGHDHDGTYAPDAHAHAHDHDGTYAPDSHAHAHDHDGTYAPDAHGHVHDHDGTYEPAGAVAAHAATPHGGGAELPAGIIVMWAGLLANIPSGWALCDGQNGTPDLRDRFVKGAAASVEPGGTGGAATHSHAAHAGVIDHTHPVAVTDPGHAHVEQTNSATTGPSVGWPARDTSTNSPVATDYSTAPATTGITASATAPAGAVASLPHDAVNHEPAYYALAFIQKV